MFTEMGVGVRPWSIQRRKVCLLYTSGPLALADLIGLDVCLAIMELLRDEMGEGKYRPAPLLRKMVRAGKLGRKSGEGFFRY